ncbi:unnamed protein product [Spirodela intermedia]|uniref:DYW domain-containing protein n=1 Tax=Spirodela intermedia TaxID=51605 RepID=A0A7I8JYH6_SPIIN|nr:unnamed protein product [Spirodela intermedia]
MNRTSFARASFLHRATFCRTVHTIKNGRNRKISKDGVPPSPSPPWSSVLLRLVRNNNVEEARRVLEGILPFADAQHYTIVIDAYSRAGRLREALRLFSEMPAARDLACWNSMMKGCLNCGHLPLARHLFDQMPERNTISWTTMLDGLARAGRIAEAEELFLEMPQRDIVAWNSMIFGYCRNGRAPEACALFDNMPNRNVISWTAMIGGLDLNGQSEAALRLFQQMHAAGEKPTSSTFASLLTACSNVPNASVGAQAHSLAAKLGYPHDAYVSASLISFYAACNQVDDAQRAFSENGRKTVVTWTALLTGYSSNGRHREALRLLKRMTLAGMRPNQSTFTSALNSCCKLEALDEGKVVHGGVIKVGLDLDVFVGNSLIVAYSKCGEIDDARMVFDNMPNRNLVSWNSAIAGYSQNGRGRSALEVYRDMQAAQVRPDEITYVGLLTACSHSGLLEEGRRLFRLLNQDTSLEPKLEHYVSMVDLLCRTGNFGEAEELIKSMPLEPNAAVWLALLSSCRAHSETETAIRAAQHIFDLDPQNSAAYVLLSNVYASARRWNEVSETRTAMRRSGTAKTPGFSWIMLKGARHVFACGERSHPMAKEIYQKLDWLAAKLKTCGYEPELGSALHDVDDEQKDAALGVHSERLAIAFALLSTVEGSVIRVMKNLRVCGDCHSAVKLMSRILGRQIVLRDPSRFHHFNDGSCSCGDYW